MQDNIDSSQLRAYNNRVVQNYRKSDKGGEVMKRQDNWRVSAVMPPEIEKAVYDLRKKEEFRRCSISEILRRLIEAGLKYYKGKV